MIFVNLFLHLLSLLSILFFFFFNRDEIWGVYLMIHIILGKISFLMKNCDFSADTIKTNIVTFNQFFLKEFWFTICLTYIYMHKITCPLKRLYKQSIWGKKVNVGILQVVWFLLFLFFIICFYSWVPSDLIHVDEGTQRQYVSYYVPVKCYSPVKAEPVSIVRWHLFTIQGWKTPVCLSFQDERI